MIVPVRCFSCGKPIGHLYDQYKLALEEGLDKKQALDKVDLERFCCRSAMLSHVDLIGIAAGFRRN